jgi:hypothetical protein
MIGDDRYRALRARFRASGEIEPDLYELLLRIGRGLAYGGCLAPALSPTGKWDAEGVTDAVHSWIERRLLRTGALLAAFDHANAERPFLRSLERNLRHHLENERERGEIDNLVARAHALLRDDPRFRNFIPQAQVSDSWWGLSDWDDPSAWQGSEERLLSLAWSLGRFDLFQYGQRVERASPILASGELGRLLEGLFGAAQALLTLRLIAGVLTRRFDLEPPRLISDDAAQAEAREVTGPADAAVVAELEDAAVAAIADLTSRQAEVVWRKASGATLDEIAAALGVSRGTVDNELKRVGAIVLRHAGDAGDSARVLEKMIDALS